MVKDITKEILAMLNNNHTVVKEEQTISCNYYNFVTDTIYLNVKKNYLLGLDK